MIFNPSFIQSKMPLKTTSFLFGLFSFFLFLFRACHCQHNETREYCENDEFAAACDNQLVVISSAKYGRMQSGKCLSGQFGNFNCYVDIVGVLGQWCSGRPSCKMNVRDLMIHNPCPKDLRGYLSASYYCVEVEHPLGVLDTPCNHNAAINAPLPSGVLSNYVAEVSKCGGSSNPWEIKAKEGQRILIDVVDFSAPHDTTAGNECQILARVRDKVVETSEVICFRSPHHFTSNSHHISISLTHNHLPPNPLYALIKYEVIGCPDNGVNREKLKNIQTEDQISLHTRSYWFHRVSKDKALHGCHGDSTKYQLVCTDNRWQGDMVDCSRAKPYLQAPFYALGHLSSEVLLLVAGVTCVIGVIILVVGVLLVKRKFLRRAPQDLPRFNKYDHPGVYVADKLFNNPTQKFESPQQQKQQPFIQPQMLPIQPQDVQLYDQQQIVYNKENFLTINNNPLTTFNSNDHIYESPKMSRRDFNS